jgi:hypothetical protein
LHLVPPSRGLRPERGAHSSTEVIEQILLLQKLWEPERSSHFLLDSGTEQSYIHLSRDSNV